MIIATQLRLDEEDYKKVKIIAEKNQRSINKQINFAIKNMIEDYEKVSGKIQIKDPPT